MNAPHAREPSAPTDTDLPTDRREEPESTARATLRDAAHLGRYPVLGPLGAGGMGEVLAVRDRELEREVAIKVVRDARISPAALARFVDEARLTGQLEHPGVVPVYELGWDAGLPYFTMKRVQGQTLADRLDAMRDGPLAPGELHSLLQILLRVADTLAYAHAQGVIHRDLKPANIMTGEFGEVYVMDWGLGKRLGVEADPESAAEGSVQARPHDGGAATTRLLADSATRDGDVVGTPAYMPPEQAAGRVAEIDQRSDVYALGAILYEILAGRPPHGGGTRWHAIARAAEGTLEPPSTLVPDRAIPRELEAIALRAMAHDPADRYPTAGAMRADLDRYLAGGMVSAARYTPIQALRHWARRHRAFVRVAAAVLATGVAVGGAFAHRERRRVAAHLARLEVARARVEALEPRAALDAVGATLAGASAAVELEPSIDELRRYAEHLAMLGRIAEAQAELARLAPTDELARRGLHEVYLAMGATAERARDYALAELVLGQAIALGLGDERPAAHLAHVRAAREARARRHAEAIERRLRQADAGELEEELVYRLATSELASYRSRATVERLCAELVAARLELLFATREALMPVIAAEDATAGSPTGVAALDTWLAWQVPTPVVGPRPPDPDPAQQSLVERALTRLVSDEARRVRRTTRVRPWPELLAAAQARVLAAKGPHRATRLRLSAEVLGMLGEPAGATDALAGYLWAEWDEHRAMSAGRALAWLTPRSARAASLLRELAGLDETSTAPRRWGVNTRWWQEVARDLARAHRGEGSTEPEPAGREPTDAASYVIRGLARDAQGDRAGALADYARALELDPAHAPAHANRGNLHRRAGDLAAALADHTRAIELDPGQAPYYTNRGNVLAAMGDGAGALRDYDRAIELDPAPPEPYNNRGATYQQAGDLTRAIRDYGLAIERDSHYAFAWINRGLARLKRGEHDLAIADLTEAIALDSRSAPARGGRGQARLARGDHLGAMEDLRAALELDPTDARLHAGLGRARAASGDQAGAIVDYTRALDLDPRDAATYGNRGAMRLATGDPDGAILDFTRVIELAPRDARGHGSRGAVRQERGDIAGAIEDLTRAAELELGAWTYVPSLARALAAAGRSADGIARLRIALERAPPPARPPLEAALRELERR